MNVTALRAVMGAEEYKRERQRLQELYGDPDAESKGVVAKRDQAFAELFYRSGWTREQLAEQENKKPTWVVQRLRFGRFLGYATNIADAISVSLEQLTEGKFRGYWEQTEKNNDDEAARFNAVVSLMQAPPAPPLKERKTPQANKAKEVIRPILEAGKSVNQIDLAKELGVSNQAVITAYNYERGRLDGLREADNERPEIAPTEAITVGKSAQLKLAALEKRLRERLEFEFRDRVQQEVTRHINEYLLPYYKERLEKAELLMKAGKPFNNAQYISILRALHPDSSNDENRHAAFILLKAKEPLLRPEEKDRPLTTGLPATLSELLARKKAVRRK